MKKIINFLAVSCPNDGELRLETGLYRYNNMIHDLVQICINGTWRYILYDILLYRRRSESSNIAMVICKQLGYSRFGITILIEHNKIILQKVPTYCMSIGSYLWEHFFWFNEHTFHWPVYQLNNLRCTGSEEHLLGCSYLTQSWPRSFPDRTGVTCNGKLVKIYI